MLYSFSNKFINFLLFFETKINIEALQNFFGKYANIKPVNEIDENYDLKISFLNTRNNKVIDNNTICLDNHNILYKKENLYVYIEKDNEEEIVFIKRILTDLSNRFFELKGGIFLHSSSIVDLEKSIIFIGDKGSGKTTNMLYLLDKCEGGYSSNERTGIIIENNKILTYGNPARINVRANTLKYNHSLKEKLWTCIDKEKYALYKDLNLPMNSDKRLVISFNDIYNNLGVEIIPIVELGAICNLIYDPSTIFKMEKVNFQNFIEKIQNSTIDGVFQKRIILNEIFQKEQNNNIFSDNIFNEINCYNIYQDNTTNNSKKILKILRKDIKNGND